jgi:2-methylcitrate dehydratase PrpD
VDLSEALARHVSSTTFADVPSAALDAAKRSLLDALGVSAAASTLARECLPFVELARAERAAPACTILGFGERTSPQAAVLANGALAHALDFEDAHDGALVHPNAAVVPVLLALAESRGGVQGPAFLTALAVGCDLTCRLSLAAGEALRLRGWYPPSLLGGLGATAAAASLLGLDQTRVLDAFSLAIGELGTHGELMHSRDSVLRSVRDAFPARAALTAALLAERGVRGFDRPLDGASGFFTAYAGGDLDVEPLLGGLGSSFAGAGISFKPWPSCRATHPFVEAMLALVREDGLRADELEQIVVTGGAVAEALVAAPRERKLRPGNVIEAKFSVYFTTAVAAATAELSLRSFDRLGDPQLLALAERVEFVLDPALDVVAGRVAVTTRDGRSAERSVVSVYGTPERPLSDADLRAKFDQCASFAAAAADWDRVADTILALDTLDDVGASLAPLLSRPPSH